MVGDVGSYSCKMGFAGEDFPRAYFPSVSLYNTWYGFGVNISCRTFRWIVSSKPCACTPEVCMELPCSLGSSRGLSSTTLSHNLSLTQGHTMYSATPHNNIAGITQPHSAITQQYSSVTPITPSHYRTFTMIYSLQVQGAKLSVTTK